MASTPRLFDKDLHLTDERLDDWEAAKYIGILRRRIADLEGEFKRRGIDVDSFRRADQNCICDVCKKPYGEHPLGGSITYEYDMILRRLCNGDLIKI